MNARYKPNQLSPLRHKMINARIDDVVKANKVAIRFIHTNTAGDQPNWFREVRVDSSVQAIFGTNPSGWLAA